jgi:double-stranded uracil-DNA glycosylase
MTRSHCFAPLLCPETRVVVLGSLPGVASLQAGQYYAHPRNQFWRLLGDVLGTSLVGLEYRDRVDILLGAGVGLWDVVASARRQGSLDAAIRDRTDNDLEAVLGGLPRLAAVAFNGKTAGRAAPRLSSLGCALLQLPSSSPALTMPYDNKLALWHGIGRYL